MKIEKVEIQAFRAYQKIEDGTFDFMISEKEPASFVSLYAPNGFGKTSFYDAVEWAVTNNIHRFLTNEKFNKEAAKSEKNINAKTKQNIIRNKEADKDIPCLVRVHVQNREPIENILKWKTGSDYKFDKNATVRGYFKQVILSQEWIDAFLREESPAERYKIFVEYFGNSDLDKYYRDIAGLERAAYSNIKKNEKEISNLKLDLAYAGDTLILKNINDQIEKINSLNFPISLLDTSFTESDMPAFTTDLASLKSIIDKDINQTDERIKAANDALYGNETIPSIDRYYASVQLLKNLREKAEELQKLVAAATSKNTIEAEIELLKTQRNDKAVVQLKNDQYLASWQPFEQLLNQLSETNNTVSANEILIRNYQANVSSMQLERNPIISDIETLNASILSLQNQIDSVPDLEKKYNEAVSANGAKTEQGGMLLKEIENLDADLVKTNIDTSKRKSFLQIILASQFQNLTQEQIEWKKVEISEINSLLADLEIEEAASKRLQEEHASAEALSNELTAFLKRGLELAALTQTGECPLCESQYKSYEELAERISGNKSITSNVQRLLLEIGARAGKIEGIRSSITSIKGALVDWIKNEILHWDKLIEDIEAKLREKRNLQNTVNADLTKHVKDRTDIELILNGKTFIELIDELSNQLTDQKAKRGDAENKKSVIDNSIIEIEAKIRTLIADNSTLAERATFVAQDPFFADFERYFKNLSVDSDFGIQQLEINKLSLTQQLEAIDEKIANGGRSLNDLPSSIGTVEELSKSISDNKEQMALPEKEVNAFRRHVNARFGILAEALEKVDLKNKIESLIKNYAADKERFSEATRLLDLVSELVPNIAPFLRSENAKKTKETLLARNKNYENIILPEIIEERTKLETYLSQQINSFFYEDVINQIYSKIDPHPDYKKIKFKCDFSDDKPQLNVCVTDEKEEELLIPNLYFSTAQINVLSLSIFLAKALHGLDDEDQPVDCIFIDDPIQSMDSINVLSTIDLLRSLSVNYNKQIVLSTHDENFHELLKKKIPKEVFKAQFLELDSFGMVRMSN